jgi:hypothetical protein
MSDRSEAQKAASRENGKKSQGPTSPEGKKKSRQNALKHGLAGAGVVLPDDLKQEVEAEILIFERGLKPQGEFEQRLVHKAAVSSAKFMRIAAAELTRAYDRQRQALDRWDTKQMKSALKHARCLDPRHTGTVIENAQSLVDLENSTAGCRLMVQAWDDLIESLETNRAWSPNELNRVARLLGYFSSLTQDDTPPDFKRIVADNNTASQLKRGQAPPEIGVPAYQALLDLAHEERERLQEQADHLWTTRDVHSRNEAPTRALVDPTKTGQLLNRYKSDAHRIEKQAIEELHRHRRQQARDRSSPPPSAEVTPGRPSQRANLNPHNPLHPPPFTPKRTQPHPSHSSLKPPPSPSSTPQKPREARPITSRIAPQSPPNSGSWALPALPLPCN